MWPKAEYLRTNGDIASSQCSRFASSAQWQFSPSGLTSPMYFAFLFSYMRACAAFLLTPVPPLSPFPTRDRFRRHFRAHIYLSIFLLTSASALLGLDPDKHIDQYGHDVWTPQHGLPGEAVYQILQTPDGYLWMPTSEGLVRFDGVRFAAMDTVTGSEPVRAIAMSADGDLLIRTNARTLVYKNGIFSDYLTARLLRSNRRIVPQHASTEAPAWGWPSVPAWCNSWEVRSG